MVLTRMACQALVLILSARLLGVENYGVISAVVAISLLLGPWSGLGYDFVALRAVSRDKRESSRYFWLGVRTIVRTSSLLIAASLVIVWLWFNDHYRLDLVALVFTAELACLRVTELIAKIFQGSHLFREMAVTRLSNSVGRLLVLASVATTVSRLTAVQWAWAYLLAGFLSLVFSLLLLQKKIGINGPKSASNGEGLSDGIHFAAGITSVRLNSEFDKALVLEFAGASSAGVYGAGYRLISSAVAPVVSLVNVVVGSLFRLQADSQRVSLRNRSLLLITVATSYGAAIAIALWSFLPAIANMIFGEDFHAIVEGLLPLALLPVAMSGRLVGEQVMAAASKLRFRTMAQWIIAVAAVSLNFVLIPEYGWTAAAWILLVGEASLAICYFAAIIRFKLSGDQIDS